MRKEHAAEDVARRVAVVAAVEANLKARQRAAVSVSKAAKRLAEAWRTFEQFGTAIIDDLRPFSRALGTDSYVQIKQIIRDGEVHSLRPQLGGELVDGGLVLREGDFIPWSHRAPNPYEGVIPFAENRNDLVLRIASDLLEKEVS